MAFSDADPNVVALHTTINQLLANLISALQLLAMHTPTSANGLNPLIAQLQTLITS